MRKVLPILWRYLLVVGVSCALAYLIARSPAYAAEPSIYAASGPFSVETTDAVWRDPARQRDMPIRVHAPIPTAKLNEKFPVIIFSHGLGGSREGGVIWAKHWASHGFMVVHPQHVGSDESLWKDKPTRERLANMKSGGSLENKVARVADVKFVLDEITRLHQASVAPFSRADLLRIGMSGHSFGALTTLGIAGQKNPLETVGAALDPRVRAAIALSPNARFKLGLDRQFAGITMPFMTITGTADGSVLGDGTTYEDRTLPYQHMLKGNKYLLVFADGDHMVFGGHTLPASRAETPRDRKIQQGVKAASTAFWFAHLRDDAAAKAWLHQGGVTSAFTPADKFNSK